MLTKKYNDKLFELLQNYNYSYRINNDHFFIDGTTKSHKKENFITKRLIFIDLDPVDKNEILSKYNKEISNIAYDLEAFGLVKTGRGFHMYFMLDKPIPINLIKNYYSDIVKYYQKKVKNKLRKSKLSSCFNIDECSRNFTQPIRLPGSINSKNNEKCDWVYQKTDFQVDTTKLFNTLIISEYETKIKGYKGLDKTLECLNNIEIEDINELFSEKIFKMVLNELSIKKYGHEQDLTKNIKCVFHKEDNPSAAFVKINDQLRYADYHIENKKGSPIENNLGQYRDIIEIVLSNYFNKNVVVHSDMRKFFAHMFIDIFNIKVKKHQKKKASIENQLDFLLNMFKNNLNRIQLEKIIISLKNILSKKLNHDDKFMITQSFLSSISTLNQSTVSKIMNLFVTVGLFKRTALYIKSETTWVEIDINEREKPKYKDCYFTYKYEINPNLDIEKVAKKIILFLKKHEIKLINKKRLYEFFKNCKEAVDNIKTIIRRSDKDNTDKIKLSLAERLARLCYSSSEKPVKNTKFFELKQQTIIEKLNPKCFKRYTFSTNNHI